MAAKKETSWNPFGGGNTTTYLIIGGVLVVGYWYITNYGPGGAVHDASGNKIAPSYWDTWFGGAVSGPVQVQTQTQTTNVVQPPVQPVVSQPTAPTSGVAVYPHGPTPLGAGGAMPQQPVAGYVPPPGTHMVTNTDPLPTGGTLLGSGGAMAGSPSSEPAPVMQLEGVDGVVPVTANRAGMGMGMSFSGGGFGNKWKN